MNDLRILMKKRIADYWIDNEEASEEEKQEHISSLCPEIVSLCEERFKSTKNTIYVWIALGYIDKNDPLPEWIYSYVTSSARRLSRINTPKNFNTELKSILDVDGNSFRRLWANIDSNMIRNSVERLKFAGRAKSTEEALELLHQAREQDPRLQKASNFETLRKKYFSIE